MSACLFTPVLRGLWRQCELWDGTYTLDDLLDIHEALQAAVALPPGIPT